MSVWNLRRGGELAQRFQDMIQSEDCFVAGLAGDYGEVCLEVLRHFDAHDHDPARAAREVDTFCPPCSDS